MALKTFRPLTPVLRFKSLPAFTEITKSKPHKGLTEIKRRSGGRNNNGRLTARHTGGGHKQKYRKVHFQRRQHRIPADAMRTEDDPNRCARRAPLQHAAGALGSITASAGL